MAGEKKTRLTTGVLSGVKVATPGTLLAAEIGLRPDTIGVRAVPVAVDEPQVPPPITRGGKEVPKTKLDPRLFEGVFVTPKPLDEPRVVAQSPTEGTPVARGSQVDLIVTAAREVPFDVFVEPHKGFRGKTIGNFEALLDDDATRNSLLAHENSTSLPAADRERLMAAMRQQNIAVDENDSQATFERAFQTLRGAAAFR
jgi:hypothetical protein